MSSSAETLPQQAAAGVLKRTPIRRLATLLSGAQLLAWVDQGVVSATNFFALVMIGRYADAKQLGVYAVASSVLALFLAAQEAVITRPYAIQLHRPAGTPAEHAFSSMLLSSLLSAGGILLLAAAGLLLFAFYSHTQIMEIVLALAMALAFVLLREFARRFGFAHLNLKQVLLLDVVVAVLNLLFLSLLVKSGELSAVTALLALALSCAVGSIGWLWLVRREFAFCLLAVQGTIKQSWQLGKWLLCGQLAIQVQGYVTYWLSMLIAGAAVTGIYAACMSLVGFLNPLLFGFYNILTPRSVRVLHNGGGAALRRDAARNSLVIAAVISPLCLLLIMFGDDLLRLIYAGGEYSGSGQILAILAISSLAAAVGAPASIALATAEHGRALAAVMGATALLNVILVWYLMGLWGLVGAAYAVLIAEVLGSVGRWASFLALVPNAGKGEAG